MNWILEGIIASEFGNNVRNRDWNKIPTTHGMLMSFTIGNDDPMAFETNEEELYHRYPTRELFIWGPMNYIGVFTRDRMIHPDESSPWYILSYHDSCWREDGVGRFLRHVGKNSSLRGSVNHWYGKFAVPDACRQLVKEYPDHDRHPVIV